MEKTIINNGLEGAENSSNQNKADLRLPVPTANDSRSYSKAIKKYLGCKDLEGGPTTNTWNGVEYTFDYFDMDSSQEYKVLKGFDEKTYWSYLTYPSNPDLILDAEYLPCLLKRGEGGDELIMGEKVAKQIYRRAGVYIYYDGMLWEYSRGHKSGEWIWTPMQPSEAYCRYLAELEKLEP
jgi:hypothetical protein